MNPFSLMSILRNLFFFLAVSLRQEDECVFTCWCTLSSGVLVMHRLKHGIVSLVLLSSNPSITVVHFPIYTLYGLYKNPIWEIFTSQVCCSRNLIIFLTRDKFLGCTCQEWRLPVGPYQIRWIHFLCRYRSRAAGGYYSVCLSACDFQLPVRSGCFASTACCLPPPVPSLPGHILLFLSVDRNSWYARRRITFWEKLFFLSC